MKKFIPVIVFVALATCLFAQSPQKLSYQAVIRNSTNQLITTQAVGMRISIIQGSVSGASVYTETQTPVTNANGLVSIEIGGAAGFTAINWAEGPYFIKTETDPAGGTNYTITGTSQLLSVPYALHSKTAEALSGGITETDPLFSTSPAKGITSTNITNWTTAFGWGNHSGLYRPISYVPAWSEITSNPFAFSLAANNQLIKYNSSSGKWENWTPTYLTSFTETDPQWTSASTNYYTKTNMQTSGASALHFNNLTNKPTTLAGYGITDADGSNTNEIQALSLAGNDLSLSKGGGTVTLPYYSGDNWGTQSVIKDATLSGNGTTATPLKIAQQSAITGQVLKWNGTTWNPANDITGGSLWAQNGSDIYYAAGKVGIGTHTPEANLQILGNSNANFPQLLLSEIEGDYARLSFKNTAATTKNWAIAGRPDPTDANSRLNVWYWNGATGADLLSITGDGKLGIGTTTPVATLQICGNSNTNLPQLLLSESEGDYARLSFKNTAATTKSWSVAGRPDPADANSRLNFWYWNGTTGADLMSLSGDGKVGIGTTTPAATLDVAGTVKIGSLGRIISEIIEITGITTNSYNTTDVHYPSGYTWDNTRVLSCEINKYGSWWITLGSNASTGGDAIQVYMDEFRIYIQCGDDDAWHNKPFRLLLMKVQ